MQRSVCRGITLSIHGEVYEIERVMDRLQERCRRCHARIIALLAFVAFESGGDRREFHFGASFSTRFAGATPYSNDDTGKYPYDRDHREELDQGKGAGWGPT